MNTIFAADQGRAFFTSGPIPASHRARLRAISRAYADRPTAFRGVKHRPGRTREGDRWDASITHEGRRVHLGSFKHERAAAAIYDIALIALGFAPVNHLEGSLRGLAPEGAFDAALVEVCRRLGIPVPVERLQNRPA